MKASLIFQHVDKRPFKPIVFVLESGERIPLDDPDFFVVIPNRAIVDELVVWHPKRSWSFEPSVVTAIERGKRNGRRRSR